MATGKSIPPPDDDRSNYSFYSSSDTSLTVSTMPGSSGAGYLTTGTCSSCGQSPCICSSQWGSVTIQSTPQATPIDLAETAELVEKLRVCIVCGAEDSIVLCEVCVEAVKLARNKWLDEYRREIASLDRN